MAQYVLSKLSDTLLTFAIRQAITILRKLVAHSKETNSLQSWATRSNSSRFARQSLSGQAKLRKNNSVKQKYHYPSGTLRQVYLVFVLFACLPCHDRA